jgi:transposase
VIAKPQGRPAGQFGKLSAHVVFLTDLVEGEPDITLQELANALENTYGVSVHLSSIHRVLVRSGSAPGRGVIPTVARAEWSLA